MADDNGRESYNGPDLAKFSKLVDRHDLARSNMFLVRFADFMTTLNKDGVLDFELTDIVPDDAGDSQRESQGNRYVFNRISDKVNTAALKYLPPDYKRFMGAYDPSIIRDLGGEELANGFDNIRGTSYDVNRDLAIFVKSVTAPSATLDVDIHHFDRSPFYEIKGRTNSNLRMTFYCTPDFIERRLFLSWMNAAHNPDRNTYGFHDTYSNVIEVFTLDRKGNKRSVVHMDRCFPVSVGEVTYSYDSNNEVVTFDVEFAVGTMRHLSFVGSDNAESFGDILNKGESLVRRGIGAGGAFS